MTWPRGCTTPFGPAPTALQCTFDVPDVQAFIDPASHCDGAPEHQSERGCTGTPERERLRVITTKFVENHCLILFCGPAVLPQGRLPTDCGRNKSREGPSWSTSRGGFELWGQGATFSLAQDVSKYTRGQSCYSGCQGEDEAARNPPRLVQLDPRAS